MSIALCVGFIVAYPINWWLVSEGLKHGMKTVSDDGTTAPLGAGLALAGGTLARVTHPRHNGAAVMDESMGAPHGSGSTATDRPINATAGHDMGPSNHSQSDPSRLELATMAGASFTLLAAGVAAAALAGSLLGG